MQNIKVIVLDVDGTLTDGSIYYSSNGTETKKFNIKDGTGIKLAESSGIELLILTGRTSECVSRRAVELGIKYIYQGINDKKKFLYSFMKEHFLTKDNVAYIGDDLNDLPAMKIVGMTACPADACSEVRAYVNYCLKAKGGDGAVREFIELVLKRNNFSPKFF